MDRRPELAVILSTYERPDHLRRSLMSLAMQRDVAGRFEVVVTDDGSVDNTEDVVRRFAQRANFPVSFTTHEHDGFRLARSRNEGVRVTRAPYLLFSDGDCVFPVGFLRQHLAARRVGWARSGDCLRLDEEATRRIDEAAIADGAYERWVSRPERLRVLKQWRKDLLYQVIRHPRKPKLVGCNIGVWRCDFERINGFDECFVGWGCEDDDLAQRLRQSGVRVSSMLHYTRPYHLWHTIDPSQSSTWRDGHNVRYFLRKNAPTRCIHGFCNLDESDKWSHREDSRSRARTPRTHVAEVTEASDWRR